MRKDDGHPLAALANEAQQRALADAGLAGEDERRADARPGAREEPLELSALSLATEQHGLGVYAEPAMSPGYGSRDETGDLPSAIATGHPLACGPWTHGHSKT